MNPLLDLKKYGQAIWLDYIKRSLITSGELASMIAEDGLAGMTSNPAIFEKAIVESHDYDDDIRILAHEGLSAPQVYNCLSIKDIQMAADTFRSVYDSTKGHDGLVSLEVNPHLAHDTAGTIEEARRLWAELKRPNVFIKVPATLEGLPAIEQLISEGINVNVTLLFGLPRYRQVAERYIAGLERRLQSGKPIREIRSVASFFLSRIDTLLDPQLQKMIDIGGPKGAVAKRLLGMTAIASAKIAYQMWKDIFSQERFKPLSMQGGQTQRVLWASTSTKNPAYSDVKYVDALIGPETVNTVPPETFWAYKNHGSPSLSLEKGVDEAKQLLNDLATAGISIDSVTQQLEDEGVDKFCKPFDHLLQTLGK